MATYGWKLADNSGNPLTGPIDWNTPGSWMAYPVANPPVTGTVPGAADSAFVIAGTVNVSTGFGSFANAYPVTVDVTTGQTVTTLGLGGIAITGVNFGTGTPVPVFGTPSVLPTLDINGGSLDVKGNIEDNFTGTIALVLPLFGAENFAGTFSDGGVIDLAANGTLEVGGTVGAAITVDFDNQADVLKLDGVNNTAPGAFAGVIQGFTVGNSIVLSTLPALHTVTETYSAGMLTVTDSTLGKLASLDIQGAPGAYATGSFALTKGTNSVTITEVPPPSFGWKNAVSGDWATAAGWTPAGPPNAANADATIAVAGAYTVTIAAAESFLVDSLTFAPTGAAVLALNGTLTLGGAQAAMTESSGTVKLAGTIAGGTFNLSGGALSDIGAGVISSAAVLAGGSVTIAAAKTLTLSGATTLSNVLITGPGTLATTGATSITAQTFLDGSLVWNNTGTVSVTTSLLTGYPSGGGKVTINNLAGGAFNLTADGQALQVNVPSVLALINAGVFSKTAGTGVSQLTTAIANTGTVTVTSGTLELDGGSALGGTIGATGAGLLALNAGIFTVAGTTQTITGALALEGGTISLATGKTLTLAGPTTLGAMAISGPGTLATTGATSIIGQAQLDGSLVWNNTGTVSAGTMFLTGYPSGAGKVTINNQIGGAFDLTADGQALTVNLPSTLAITNAGVLAKTVGTGLSTLAGVINSTGTITTSTGSLELDGGGTLGGTVVETATGAVTLGAGVFAYTGAITGPGTLTVDSPATLALTTVSDSIANAVVLNGGMAIAAAKTLTLSGPVALSGADIVGPGTLTTAGTTSIVMQAILDGNLVWNNTGIVLAGADVLTGYPSGTGKVTIANQTGGVFDLTVDGEAFVVNAPSTLLLSNAGVLSKTAGTGISQISTAVTNTGTLTATSGTLELDGGGTLGGTIGATSAGLLALNGGIFTVGGTTQSITGALALEGGIESIAAGKTLTLAGTSTLSAGDFTGPGTLATTGTASIVATNILDGNVVWDNTGTVLAGATVLTGYPSGAGKVTIANQTGGVFDLTVDGQAFTVNQPSTLLLSNAGVLSKTAGTGISQISTAVTNTGTLTVTSGTLELDGGGALGGTIGATGAGLLALNGGTFTVGGTTQSITGVLAVEGGIESIAAGKTLTLAGTTTLSGGDFVGPGILSTTGTESIVATAILDGDLVWNNTGTVLAGATVLTGYPSGIGNVTIANQMGGVFDLTADGQAFTINGTSTLALSNAGVLSKTAGTGISQISNALTNTGTLTATHGTLELDGGATLGGTIGATGAGSLALNTGIFTLGGATQTITGALALEGGDVSIATGKTLTLSGAVTWSGSEVDGPGRLATTGKTTITGGGADLDNGLTWTNTGTVLAGSVITTGNPSGTGTIAIVNAAAGIFDVTNAGAVFNVVGTSALTLNNGGTLAKTAGAGLSTIAAPVTNTGTITSSSGTLDLNGGGTLGGTIGGTGTGLVLLDAGGSFATTGTLAIADAGASNDLRIGNGGTLTDSGLINDSGHFALGNAVGASALVIAAAGKFDFTADDGGIFNGTLGTLSNAGTLAKTGGIGTSTVAVAFTNTGTVDAASGILKLNGAVAGTGQMRIEAGDTLEIATGAVAATNTVDFNGLGATLKIDNNAAVAKPIIGLGGGSRIDLGAATSATAVISGTTLTVTPTGGAALKFVSTTSLAALHATTGTDGGTGTVVTLYNQAVASTHTPEPVAFGNVHVGDTAVQALAIGNTAPVGIYTEKLDASLATTATAFTAIGSVNGIAAGAANNAALTVALKTATAGNITGTATLTPSTDGTGVDGFVKAALTPQTVNVTGAVYAFAAPNLSTTTLNFGAARVGDAALAQSLTLGDGSNVNAFQESLVYSVAPGPASVSFSNGSGTIASGGSVTIGATLATSTAGDFTGSNASLALTSTGVGTSGLADTALTAQALTLSGKVYADAVANFSASSVNFGVVHVGDTVSQNLALTNAASGALTDGLTGGTDTLGGTYTGPVGFVLGAGGLATETSGTVSFGLNTVLSGAVSGNVMFGFTSHDADLADLGINGGTVAVTGTVDNFATAQVEDTGGVGSFAGSNGNYTLNLGSVIQGGAALVGDLGVLNAASGLADLLSGTFAVTGAGSFTNSGFTPGFSGLGAGKDERSQAITLSTATSGVLSETIVLTPTGSNANFSGVLTQETITVTGTIVPAGVTYTLTPAPITIAGGVGNDTVIVKNAMLNSHDAIDGGGGTNTVQLSGPGSFDLGAPAQFANIQSVVAAEGQAGGAGSQIVYMRNAANLTLNVTTGIPVAGNVNPETITIYGAAASDVLNLGAGTDNVVLGGAGETVNGGGGIALLHGAAAFAGALVNGGTGKTTLELTTGGTATLNAGDNNLTVNLDAITNLTLSKMSFITAVGSTGADTITAMASGQTLTGAGGADILTGFSGFGDTFADTAAGLNGDTLKLFGGSDTIDVSDVSSTLAKALVYTGNTTAGALNVSDGTHTANIKFTGSYTTANFQLATDTHGGSLITFH